ncbi:MAG: serine hydrolase [Planctomycetota bacterium]|nr:serine hydrolase [Planctomycetota bacterium]
MPDLRLLSFVLALAAPPWAGLPAQSPEPADVRALLEPIRAELDVPALAACVIRRGAVVAEGAVGLRARGSEEKVTIDDLWHLGSCTKAMTATLVATFVDEGKLAWDQTLGASFPDLADTMHEDFRGATVRQLLQHRAGLPANPNQGDLWGELYAWEGTTRAARRHVAERMLAAAPLHAPGSKFLYSNAGYMLAGAVVEELADAPWEELMAERVFGPLGIDSAGFGAPGSADAVDQPRGHRAEGPGIPPGRSADNPASLGPAGTVHMELSDWARFVSLHLGARRGEAAIVSGQALAAMHDGVPREDGGRYALGFGVTQRGWADGPILSHTGSNTMWFCVVWAAPDEDFAVLAACNLGGDKGSAATDRACAALIGRFGHRVSRR